jgi:hypothetical protein
MSGTCSNGRVNPSSETKLRLFSDSAGHCNRPNCHRYLFSDSQMADYNIGEMAHIIAASGKGPRADYSLGEEDKATYDNLILLCPSCHTEIDKAPGIFPKELIIEWKKNHRATIIQTIGIPRLETRGDGKTFVKGLLRKNKAIFDSLNPELAYKENPEAEEATVWNRKMIAQIIPNNQRILIFLDQNFHLLNDGELLVVESFRQHLDDLIERHLGDNLGIASRFPTEMNNILEN